MTFRLDALFLSYRLKTEKKVPKFRGFFLAIQNCPKGFWRSKTWILHTLYNIYKITKKTYYRIYCDYKVPRFWTRC